MGVRRSDGLGNANNCSDIGQGEAILQAIAKLHPSHVILASRWSLYTNGMRNSDGVLQKDTHFVTTSADGEATMQTGKAAFDEKFLPTIAALSQIAPVLIIKNFPVLPKPVNSALTVRVSWYHDDTIEPTLEQHLRLSDVPYHWIDEAAKLPHVKVFDPTPLLCNKACAPIKDGVVMYRDDNHPSSEGALLFAPYIKQLME